MGIVSQPSLFSWEIVEKSPEILRLKRVLEFLPDNRLLDALEAARKRRRNDYPLVAMWNSLIAGVVFGHESVASLMRELSRNAELREVCGFDPLHGEKAVPNAWNYSRFFSSLFAYADLVEDMFERLVDRVGEALPDFGNNLAIDAKAVPTHGRKDEEANWGCKTYKGVNKNGKAYEKVYKWFGYKLHLLVDANYELPVAFEMTRASEADINRMMPMIENLAESHPDIHERAETLCGDKGYDDGADMAALYDDHEILPIIDTRDCFSNTPQGPMRPLDEQSHDTIYYGPTGEVMCKVDPFASDDEQRYVSMQFMGFESDRRTLKFRCPAAAYGTECKNRDACKAAPQVKNGDYGRVVRVSLDRDRRLFLPAHRHSRTFRDAYKKRSSVERVNSRIDQVYGFERHFIRGIKKIKLRMGLALIVMLATAVAWIEADKAEHMRSLLKAG